MTPERLMILILGELAENGFTVVREDRMSERIPLNEPTTIGAKAIRDRIQYGDVTCTPDAFEVQDRPIHG